MIYIEYEKKWASPGVAGSGLGLGIAGTALGLLNANGGGLLGGLFGGNCACAENIPVNRYEMGMQRDLTNKDMEIAYLKGRDAAKTDSLELYKYIDGKFACVERELADQRVFNATQVGNISCIQAQIAQLQSLTRCIIPAANICPAPMPQYNSWTAPTAAA